MRVRITDKAGYENPKRGLELKVGAVVEVPDDLAVKLLHHGIAAPAPAPVIETAVAPAPAEKAAPSKPKTKAPRSSSPAKGKAD